MPYHRYAGSQYAGIRDIVALNLPRSRCHCQHVVIVSARPQLSSRALDQVDVRCVGIRSCCRRVTSPRCIDLSVIADNFVIALAALDVTPKAAQNDVTAAQGRMLSTATIAKGFVRFSRRSGYAKLRCIEWLPDRPMSRSPFIARVRDNSVVEPAADHDIIAVACRDHVSTAIEISRGALNQVDVSCIGIRTGATLPVRTGVVNPAAVADHDVVAFTGC